MTALKNTTIPAPLDCGLDPQSRCGASGRHSGFKAVSTGWGAAVVRHCGLDTQSNEASLEIDLEHHTAEWHLLDMDTDQGEMCELNLDEDAAWDWTASEIRRLSTNE